ncbi:MAG: hypothetical protein NT072_03955 [Deltaproteobacteria bacterium]|nr:hypothetical protein [Deltaproteobacteria bacterium]
MKRNILLSLLCIATVISYSRFAAADEWRYPVGISYVVGFTHIADNIEENLIATKATDTDPGAFPFGISFQPYLQFDNGMRIGTGIGPSIYTLGNSHYLDIPININMGYTFGLMSSMTPYFRFGIIQHIITSDYFLSSYPGFFGALGIELFKNQRIALGLELLYDNTTIKMETKRLVNWYDIRGYNIISTYLQTGTDTFKPGYAFSIYAVF